VTQAETATQLYAVVEVGETALDRFVAALSVADFTSLLVEPPPGGTLDAAASRSLVDVAQKNGVAAIIANDMRLARTLRADGVHLAHAKDMAAAYEEARSILGRNAIVGADVGISRHDAMTVAEEGADYVAFGAPPHLEDRDKARRRRDELIAWWAEIFEAPCVALDVEAADEAAALTRAGADFIGLRLPSATTPSATRELVAGLAATVRLTATAR
jgi:thiamine-phosphate pyrophosphorylase